MTDSVNSAPNHPDAAGGSENRVVTIYSGGMDSYTLLNQLVAEGKEVFALSFNYGQRHSKELACAEAVCRKLGIAHKTVDITSINSLLAGSSLTDDIEVAEGHYAEETMKSTVVPNRNMILLSLAIGYAVSLKAGAVYYGAHGGDHAIYPDCRPPFVEKMHEVSLLANYEPVAVRAPYLAMTKIDILREGLKLGLDYSETWTCYNGREKACGKCGSCVERLEAFAENGVVDPLPYETQPVSFED